MRDHTPVAISEFNGLWRRGDPDTTPIDHFSNCENIKFDQNEFSTRNGVRIYQESAVPLGNILRLYNYITPSGNTLLTLVEGGDIYHSVGPLTVFGPILSIPAMTDFGFYSIAGNAFITPFSTITDSLGQNKEVGL